VPKRILNQMNFLYTNEIGLATLKRISESHKLFISKGKWFGYAEKDFESDELFIHE